MASTPSVRLVFQTRKLHAMGRRNHYLVYVIELSKDVLYELYNPMSYEHARDLEVELAIDFREAGYGVWQA